MRDVTKAVEELDRRTDLEAKKRFEERHPVRAFASFRRMIAEFWKVYYSENARREGVDGLFRAVNAGLFHFLTYAKHWELERNAKQGG